MSRFSVVFIILHYVVQGCFRDCVNGKKGVSGCWTTAMWTTGRRLLVGLMKSVYSCKDMI